MRPAIGLSICWSALLVLSGCEEGPSAFDPARFPLVPAPAELEAGQGDFTLDGETVISLTEAADAEVVGAVERWSAEMRQRTGLPLPIRTDEGAGGTNRIHVEVSLDVPEAESPTAKETGGASTGIDLPGVRAEAYELQVRPGSIELRAGGAPGVFYGLTTLAQLVGSAGSPPSWIVPEVEVDDAPRFS